ncbi:MAG: glycosyltransferase family 4 protein [Bryobacteraceae bacterium]
MRTPGYQGRLLDALADGCEELVCFLHSARPDEMKYMDYRCHARNIKYVELGIHDSVPRRVLRSRSVTALVKRHRGELDALLIRGPSPLLAAVAKGAEGKVLALLLVGDYVAGLKDLDQPWWRKQLISAWSHWNYRRQLSVARRAVTFVNSRALYEQLRPLLGELHETRTTTLTEADFHAREDTCQGRTVRVLYSGRINRGKGLLEVVDAIALLATDGLDVVFDLVGWAEAGDDIVDAIRQRAEHHGIPERVIFHGYKPVGPELFGVFKDVDLFVTASLHSEGFPRGIWEAMAHSLPVAVTKVGSIPFFLKDGESGLLVEPGNTAGLADAMGRIIRDGDLRRRLIKEGSKLARQQTLEALTPTLLGAIESRVHGEQNS